MTVVQPNSIAGINSISVQSGQSLSIHKSDGTLIREIVASTGISTFSSISVGSATTTNSAAKSINIGLGASISQHDANTLSFGTNGDERVSINSAGVTQITKGTSGGATANTDAALIIDNSSHTYVQFRTPDSKEQGLLFGDDADNDTGAITYSHSSNHLGFKVNAAERLRIDTNGNIGVNCDAPTNITNSRGITIQGASGTPAGFINFMDSADNSDARILADNGVLTITADASDNTGS